MAEGKTEMRDHQGPYTTSLVTIYSVRKGGIERVY